MTSSLAMNRNASIIIAIPLGASSEEEKYDLETLADGGG